MLRGAEHFGTAVMCAGAVLLLWAGLPKLIRPAEGSRRVLDGRAPGGAEVALGLGVLLGPGRVAAGVLAAVFFGFSVTHLRDLVRARGRLAEADDVSCNCFGADEWVSPVRGAILTAALGALAGGAAAVGAPSLRELAGADAAVLAWLPSLALAIAVAWRLGFSGTAPLGRLVDRSAAWIDGTAAELRSPPASVPAQLTVDADGGVFASGGLERRSFLLRVAVVGSALAVAPLRFLLYPGTALGAVVGPWDCPDGLCSGGYTGFCCEINGGSNTCPTGTFPGGWWMCTDYRGRQLCSEQNVRYYVDCNATPGIPFPGGCHCANDNCNHRKVNCNVFRYGQCNTDIEGTTAVVCRMVVCENPATISDLNCSSALSVDDSTCGHEAPCLEPHAIELAGAGGV